MASAEDGGLGFELRVLNEMLSGGFQIATVAAFARAKLESGDFRSDATRRWVEAIPRRDDDGDSDARDGPLRPLLEAKLARASEREITRLVQRYRPKHIAYTRRRWSSLIPEADAAAPFHRGFVMKLALVRERRITIEKLEKAIAVPQRFVIEYLRHEGRRGTFRNVPYVEGDGEGEP